jgi:hypothetical protein
VAMVGHVIIGSADIVSVELGHHDDCNYQEDEVGQRQQQANALCQGIGLALSNSMELTLMIKNGRYRFGFLFFWAQMMERNTNSEIR